MARLLVALLALVVVGASCSTRPGPPRTSPGQGGHAQASGADTSVLEQRVAALEEECRRERARVTGDSELLAENARLRTRVAQLEGALALHDAGSEAAEILRLGEQLRQLNAVVSGDSSSLPYDQIQTTSGEPSRELQDALLQEWEDSVRK